MITREYLNRQAAEQAAKRAEKLKDPCMRPYCKAKPGQECRTPNGYRTHHASRGRVAAVKRSHRLTDAQARRIEWAAERGVYYAPGQYATLRGEAVERACADALERAGLIVQFDTSADYERMFRLTVEGWEVFHSHRLVIRRFDEARHDVECPCRRQNAFEQVAERNNRPEVAAAQASLRARHEVSQRALLANVGLRPVSVEARGAGGAKVLDLSAKLAARNGSTGGGAA